MIHSSAPRTEIRLGTRASALAVWQTNRIAERLGEHYPDLTCTVVSISTQGDRDKVTPLSIIGGQGIFIKELEQAILAGEVDCAVHSLKDMPSDLPATLALVALLERDDPRDALISRHPGGLAGLPEGARVGTSSRRRIAQLAEARPDLIPVELRGNVDTRLSKVLDAEDYDAAILASAGVTRMGRASAISEYLDVETFTPPPGQAALAIECRLDDADVHATLSQLDDPSVSLPVSVERGFLRGAGGGCRSPIAAHAGFEGDSIRLRAMLASEDLSVVRRVDELLDPTTAVEDAAGFARTLLASIGGTP